MTGEDADGERSGNRPHRVRPEASGRFCRPRAALTVSILIACASSFPIHAQTDGATSPAEGGEGVIVSRNLIPNRTQIRDAVEQGLEYLRKQQVAGIGTRYMVAVTSLAGMAVLGAGYQPGQGRYAGLLTDCVNYLKSVEQDGYMTEQDEASRMHGHCYAVLFLTQVLGGLPPEDERDVAAIIRRGVRVIERAQSRSGGWYYFPKNDRNQDEASVTVCALQALRAARNVGIPVDSFRIKQALRYVSRCQGTDGSFAYSLSLEHQGRRTYALTVAALSTLNAAGVYRSAELTKGLEFVRRRLADYARSPWRAAEDEYPYYANLYAAQTLYQDGGDLWDTWYPAVSRYLRSKQRDDGSWDSNYGFEYGTAFAVLILEVPLGYLPIFQR